MEIESRYPYSERLHLPALGYVQINFYSCSALCYELYDSTSEIDRQSSIPHLGLIARKYSGSQHTRWEYAALQCALIDLIDRIHKGNPEVGLGSIKVDGNDLPGSEILKSWALLSNFGHCRNTFADEKTILSLLRRKKPEQRAFLNALPSGGLTAYAKHIVREYRYQDFHWCLTILRLERELAKYSRKKRPLQHIIRLLKTFDDSAAINMQKLNQLRKMFELIRKLSIVAIDSRNSHLPVNFDVSSAILGMDLSEQRTTGQSLGSIVDPIVGMLSDLLYADKHVLCLMRDYEIQAASHAERLGSIRASEVAITQGLVRRFRPTLRHVHRQVIPVKQDRDIYDERRRSERLIGRMGSVRVQVDDNKVQQKRYLDFLAPNDGASKKQIAQCAYVACRNLFNSIAFHARGRAQVHLKERDWWKERLREEGVDTRVVNKIDRSYLGRLSTEVGIREIINQRGAAVVSSVMNMLLRAPHSIVLEPADVEGLRFGLQVVRDGHLVIDEYQDPINDLIARARDHGRQNELELIKQQKSQPGTWLRLGCFDRALVIDTTRPPEKRRITDIDGIVITVSGSTTWVNLFEAKVPGGGSTNAAKRELKERLKPIIESAVLSGHRVHGYSRGAKLTLKLEA